MDVQHFIFLEIYLVVNTNTTSEYCQEFSFTTTHTFHQLLRCIYVPWWITSPVVYEATINNSNSIQQLFAYINVDELCASTTLKLKLCHDVICDIRL